MGSNKELLLVHVDMNHIALSHSVNIMLTPQFYTLKKVELPVKYLYQAKKIAPSLFDGLLDESGTYDYLVYKEDDQWVFIAYNSELIKNFLLSKGINPEQVSKIFFAQQALSSFTAPILLGKNEALVVVDNTVVLVPKAVLEEETKAIMFDNRFTPKRGIALKGRYGSLLTMKQAVFLAAIFAVFAAMFFVEGLRYSKGSNAAKKEMQVLLEAYPSLQSQYARESIAEKYKTIDRKERRKREVVKSLSDMIFKGVVLTSLSLNEKEFKAQFDCNNVKVAKRLMELAKKEKFKSTKPTDSNAVKIEGRL
ncbi:MAG: hypothetical protein P794_04125 [Epsilonproteobacteria bacterium (ex Lamellibrachia satsuma)]|nr:MAG: hypothetical protein P794_04125 [Epsilonproteobacteria bacterium (ex Lamellibrachia satsuma)]